MARLTTTLIVAAALVAMGGCAKHPREIPPAPNQNTGPVTTDNVVPGSRADFERSVTSNTVNFALDKYDIDPHARAILDSQAAWLAKWPNVPVSLEGHCDERGTREYNLALGDRRANAAKNYLAARGINPARISTISYGKERPIALGSDEASWAQNRRAVTIVLN
ncbi:MAG: peptidoglycan-associated lipoprotein [Sphingomonas bacterium]|jgi:peptidoglycan-associated lipoprotein|uniref:peptidoglycan-associated lipoprotein Pal n=1 Tax=Sphingomonas bacterium TaxID=1895847 RepID=UPI00262BED59|nr:peptidoglycan-associated lipoprotein Pal [Sphingomonas bacterium]MDB5706471.1 peptidoglycan-associated lipoprotein [Sphingomonas bacterium]